MVKRKPQYVKIKEYIIQNIEDEKYNENEQIESHDDFRYPAGSN